MSSRPTDSSSSTDGTGTKSKLKQMTIAVTRRVKGNVSRSQSPQPHQSPLVRPPSIKSHMSSQSGPIIPSSPGFLLKVKETALSDFGGDIDSIYTPRSRTPTSSSYGGRSIGGRSWRSRGGETPNSGSISSSGQSQHVLSGKEYQEKPMMFVEFLELFRLFSVRMRKDLKDLFNDCVNYSSANSHVAKRERDKQSPRLHSRLESTVSYAATMDFIPNDALTRNNSQHLFTLHDKQSKIYSALALGKDLNHYNLFTCALLPSASVSSTGLIDTSRNAGLAPAAIKQFIFTQQMEQVDDAHVLKLIQGITIAFPI